MDKSALYNICCGLFVLTAKDGDRHNGCIINTVMQVTSSPIKLSVTVNKSNYTTDMIMKTRCFNISVIDESADFSLFERFGFSSGADTDKFDGFSDWKTADNGVRYITKGVNSYFTARVVDVVDVGTHYIFIAEVDDAEVISSLPSASYSYYHKHIKPQPQKAEGEKTRWVCKICGYVYEGDTLPDDYICPLCKHPASDFEKM